MDKNTPAEFQTRPGNNVSLERYVIEVHILRLGDSLDLVKVPRVQADRTENISARKSTFEHKASFEQRHAPSEQSFRCLDNLRNVATRVGHLKAAGEQAVCMSCHLVALIKHGSRGLVRSGEFISCSTPSPEQSRALSSKEESRFRDQAFSH
jgi:hypothetical protein